VIGLTNFGEHPVPSTRLAEVLGRPVAEAEHPPPAAPREQACGVFAAGLQLAGLALPVEYPFDYVLALSWGILFQYLVIAPTRHLSVGEGLKLAAKADFLALSAFEIGLFGWMAIMQLVLFTSPHLATDTAAFWFLMQVGMLIGFITTYPVNWWLIRHGIKDIM
jgi:hypothetical protein